MILGSYKYPIPFMQGISVYAPLIYSSDGIILFQAIKDGTSTSLGEQEFFEQIKQISSENEPAEEV